MGIEFFGLIVKCLDHMGVAMAYGWHIVITIQIFFTISIGQPNAVPFYKVKWFFIKDRIIGAKKLCPLGDHLFDVHGIFT